jgi:hypothetical protein
MERITRGVRQSGMMSHRGIGGIVGAGLLCAAAAGCASVAATATSSGQGAGQTASSGQAAGQTASSGQGAGQAASAPAAPAVGCAAVNQATTVTVHRSTSIVASGHPATGATTQRNTALVRALFSDICNVITHPNTSSRHVECPADFGQSYMGTFYDGNRELATFSYGASGCQTVRLTVAGKTKFILIMGATVTAASRLEADMAAVLGVPKSKLVSPVQQVNPGGPMVSASASS